jgi:hypothetical protein
MCACRVSEFRLIVPSGCMDTIRPAPLARDGVNRKRSQNSWRHQP